MIDLPLPDTSLLPSTHYRMLELPSHLHPAPVQTRQSVLFHLRNPKGTTWTVGIKDTRDFKSRIRLPLRVKLCVTLSLTSIHQATPIPRHRTRSTRSHNDDPQTSSLTLAHRLHQVRHLVRRRTQRSRRMILARPGLVGGSRLGMTRFGGKRLMMRELGVRWQGRGMRRGRLAGLHGLREVQGKRRRIRLSSSGCYCSKDWVLYMILVCSIRSR